MKNSGPGVWPAYYQIIISYWDESVYYEGRSICNENSPVYPKVLYLHTL